MIMLKIRNSDIAIIANDKNKTAKLSCDNYVKTKVILEVYKIKTNRNCSLNNQILEVSKYYNKEIMFENINVKLEENQLTNKTLEFKQISEQEIFVKELQTINNVSDEKSQSTIYIIMAILIVIIIITLFKTQIIIAIKRVKRYLTLGELQSQNLSDSANSDNNIRRGAAICVSTSRNA